MLTPETADHSSHEKVKIEGAEDLHPNLLVSAGQLPLFHNMPPV